MWTTTATPPVERSVKVAQPLTFDPLRGSIVALASAPAGAAALAELDVDVDVDVDEHPAAIQAAPATTARAAAARFPVSDFFITPPSLFDDRQYAPARDIPNTMTPMVPPVEVSRLLLLLFVAVGAVVSIASSPPLSSFAGGFAAGAGAGIVLSFLSNPRRAPRATDDEETP